MGLFGTLSSSDGHPAGPHVAGGPVDPDDTLQVLGPLEHSVLKMTLDGGHSEIDWEPLAHSVLDVTLDGRLMEGIPVMEPLEHSVLVRALDSVLMEGVSHL